MTTSTETKKAKKASVAVDETPGLLSSKSEIVDVETLKAHPRNPRRGDVESIKESIRESGFFGALVVQKKTREILIGNHRWRAAR